MFATFKEEHRENRSVAMHPAWNLCNHVEGTHTLTWLPDIDVWSILPEKEGCFIMLDLTEKVCGVKFGLDLALSSSMWVLQYDAKADCLFLLMTHELRPYFSVERKLGFHKHTRIHPSDPFFMLTDPESGELTGFRFDDASVRCSQ